MSLLQQQLLTLTQETPSPSNAPTPSKIQTINQERQLREYVSKEGEFDRVPIIDKSDLNRQIKEAIQKAKVRLNEVEE